MDGVYGMDATGGGSYSDRQRRLKKTVEICQAYPPRYTPTPISP